MHTVIEGNLDEILRLMPQIHRACFERGAGRVSTVMKIDDRRDAPSSIAGKVRSVCAVVLIGRRARRGPGCRR